jgi:hypothetical protein
MSIASGSAMYNDQPPKVMPHSSETSATLCSVGASQRTVTRATGTEVDAVAARDPSVAIFVTHISHCYGRIKRHYRAIIHGPLVVFSATNREA